MFWNHDFVEITLKSLLLAILETSADRENSLAESISNTDLFTSKVGIDSISLGFHLQKR